MITVVEDTKQRLAVAVASSCCLKHLCCAPLVVLVTVVVVAKVGYVLCCLLLLLLFPVRMSWLLMKLSGSIYVETALVCVTGCAKADAASSLMR